MRDPIPKRSRSVAKSLTCPVCGRHPRIRFIGVDAQKGYGYRLYCVTPFRRELHMDAVGDGLNATVALSNAAVKWRLKYVDSL